MAFAGGGSVWGAGTGTSDSINARLSNGEVVIKNSVASEPGMRPFLESLNGGGSAAIPGRSRFAGGGSVIAGGSTTSSEPSVELHIHNAPPGAQVQQSKSANGGLRLDVILRQVDNHIASGIATGRGATAGAIQNQYGLNRTVGGR